MWRPIVIFPQRDLWDTLKEKRDWILSRNWLAPGDIKFYIAPTGNVWQSSSWFNFPYSTWCGLITKQKYSSTIKQFVRTKTPSIYICINGYIHFLYCSRLLTYTVGMLLLIRFDLWFIRSSNNLLSFKYTLVSFNPIKIISVHRWQKRPSFNLYSDAY